MFTYQLGRHLCLCSLFIETIVIDSHRRILLLEIHGHHSAGNMHSQENLQGTMTSLKEPPTITFLVP